MHRSPRPLVVLASALLAGCAHNDFDLGPMSMYEVNVRQFSVGGGFDAVRADLDRIERLGVGVLWLMPIHPIGEAERKGSLGSYYAVRDYRAVNPEFGTDEDFDELVAAAHERGMLVILDWVPNHTAWDHPWTETHPERYTQGPDGGFTPPNDDWVDVIDLNYDEPSTGEAMLEAMRYWVNERGVDGFRCDVAELVPDRWWREAIQTLRADKSVFMFAEGDDDWLVDVGFDARYGWGLSDRLLRIAQGNATAVDLAAWIDTHALDDQGRPMASFFVHFTTNHDWNSWNGVARQRLGEAWEVMTMLTFTVPGMPLIYSGQEAGLNKQLEFFEADPILWQPHPHRGFYESLAALKRSHPALRSGDPEATYTRLPLGDPERVFAFLRRHGEREVVVIANLSGEPVTVDIDGLGTLSDEKRPRLHLREMTLEAWGWTIVRS